jgi:hypothetical protein
MVTIQMQNCAEDQGMVTMMGKRVINWIFMGVLDIKRNLRKFRFQFNLVSWILWAFEVVRKGCVVEGDERFRSFL